MSGLPEMLAGLSDPALHKLIHGLRTQAFSTHSTPQRLCTSLGIDSDTARHLSTVIRSAFLGETETFANKATVLAAETALQVRTAYTRLDLAIDIALSGPAVDQIPTRDTASVFSTLLAEARREVLITGYVVYKAQLLLTPIARFLDADDQHTARIVLDFKRENDTSLSDQIARRQAMDFWSRQWPPSRRRPDLFYAPRSLAMERKDRIAMHAKVIIIDREILFITSANLTPRAQEDNIEVGSIIRHARSAECVADYFDALIEAGHLTSP